MADATLAAARAAIPPLYREAETAVLERLVPAASLDPAQRQRVLAVAGALLARLRAPGRGGWIDRFLQEYSLSSEEGAALLGLAEAFLRVPDAATADALIRDKLGQGDWKAHVGAADSVVVNSATLGLMLAQSLAEAPSGSLRSLVGRIGEPAVRLAVAGAMQRMGEAFVLGRTVAEALRRADRGANRAFRYSFDMLGEAAKTAADADAYFESYVKALEAVGKEGGAGDALARDNVSVKLSALHPRYEPLQAGRCVPELSAKLIALARIAKGGGVGLTVDAEESDRLEMSLDIIGAAARDPCLAGWDGLGMAVQAYQRRASAVVDWAQALAGATGRRLMVRLVKGAYWDTEIKRAQERGLADYPVFTRKSATDVSYMACARRMLAAPGLFPAFATHNALTVATVLEWAGERRDFEFQRLHGMGEGLYEGLMADRGVAVRVYAPVGGYRDLLAYLVRRLLENGANTSFVHQIADRSVSDDILLADPVAEARASGLTPNPAIPLPPDMLPGRRNSAGLDFSDAATVAKLCGAMAACWRTPQSAAPMIGLGESDRGERPSASSPVHGGGGPRSDGGGERAPKGSSPVVDPADHRRVAGEVVEASAQDVAQAVAAAERAQPAWARRPVEERARILERLADLLDRDRAALMALALREAGKTWPDALAEVREAVDFCRYYAIEARRVCAPIQLPGPTGETNELSLVGRGVFACVSPWNFPLAIFLGQVAAALVVGNAVVAKPAPQTPLIADHAARLAREAGVPANVLALIPGGAEVGQALVANPRVAGVAFTGSTASARRIARALLDDESRPISPLIAETGGLNAMLVDSTALPEQVVSDAITSAFLSAGQRCSAMRLLAVHEDIAPALTTMLTGAMAELVIGDPADPATDVGPVIDAAAQRGIQEHLDRWKDHILYSRELPPACANGTFIPPTLIRLGQIADLDREIFGPVLHMVTWKGPLEAVIDQVSRSGYGLTMGLHSRIGQVARDVRARARVGNLYVNRSMIGAVVGVQPFGGEGLSGTGPKAGGPHYLPRFCLERTVTIDTTSAGGNASLLSLEA